jgi:Domain of unknown function (DUF4396)
MLDGVMLLWFVLMAAALLFVAIDIRSTPESPVLKWGFVLLTAYTGVVGAFLYVLGCREPLPGLHERYVAARWRQTLGSTMHCVAGDGVGILAGAVLSSVCALRSTFVSELLSMNLLMAGMVPTVMALKARIPAAADPTTPSFWFVMSMGLLVGFVIAYPMNWWLVAHHLKHGMMTVRPAAAAAHGAHAGMATAPHAAQGMAMDGAAPWPPVPVMGLLSFVALAAGVVIALLLRAA